MNVFNQFLIFPLRKFEPFRDFVYYSLVDRDIYFFDKPGENEMIVYGLQPYTTQPGVEGNLIFPSIFNRDFIQNQTLNHGRPSISNINTGVITSLSVLNFSRDQYSNTASEVSASFINRRGVIQYSRKNTLRFESSQTRLNLLSSSSLVNRFPTYNISQETQSGIIHKNLLYETISGAFLRSNGSNWSRALYGWEPYCAQLTDLETAYDVPDELKNITSTSQYFYLSVCQGCGGLNHQYSSIRNSPLAIYANTGNLNIPYIEDNSVGYTVTQVDSNWARYSITIPAAYWGWRQGAPSAGSSPRNSGLWNKWGTFENGTRGRIQWDRVPHVTCALLGATNSVLGTYAYWGPQLEYGLSATEYQFTALNVITGGRGFKNLIAPLTGVNYRGGAWSFWRHRDNDGGSSDIQIHGISSDTPFGINSQNPSYLLKGSGSTWGQIGFYTNVDLVLPQDSAPGINLLRNTDFSGAEVGDVFFRDSNNFSSEWFGDYRGRGPYWQSVNTGLRNTFIRIVSTGNIDGCNYVDYRFFRPQGSTTEPGFGNDEINLHPEGWTYVRANAGETFTFSVSCALIAGNFPGTWSGGSSINPTTLLPTSAMFIGVSFTGIVPGGGDSLTYFRNGNGGSWRRNLNSLTLSNRLTGISVTATATDSRIARVVPEIVIPRVPAISAFDFTLRLCGPKLELGSTPTTYTPTPTILHTLSTVTFSCYIKYISGGMPSYGAPVSTTQAVGGLIQRTGWVDPLLVFDGVQITNSMYVKIDGPGVTDSSRVKFSMGINDGSNRVYYATNKWQRVQYTQFYSKNDSFDNIRDGRGFQFAVNRNDSDNSDFNPSTTKFYFAGLQSEINSKATEYIPTDTQSTPNNAIDGLLIEPTRSNLAVNSTRFNLISGAVNNTRAEIINGIYTPDAGDSVTRITCPVPGTSYFYLTGFTTGEINKKYTISFYIKPVSVTNSTFIINQHPLHDGTTVSFSYDFFTNRVINLTPTTASLGIDNLLKNWKRIYYTVTCNKNNGNIWPGFGVATASPNNQFYLWGVQIEEGDTPTSYIPVNNFIGTRERDVLVLSGSNLWSLYKSVTPTTLVSNNSSTIYIESKRKYLGLSNQKLFQIEERNNVIQTPISFGTTVQIISSSLYNSGLTLNIPTSWYNTTVKTAFTYNNISDRFTLASNGVSVSGTYTRNIQLSAYYFGGVDFNGYIRKIIIFPEVINMKDLKIITT